MIRIFRLGLLLTLLSSSGFGSSDHPCSLGSAIEGSLSSSDPLGLTVVNSQKIFGLGDIIIMDIVSSRQFLDSLTDYTFYYDESATDRYGRYSAHIFGGDNDIWVQGELLLRGLAVSLPRPSLSESCRFLLEERERSARRSGSGIWSRFPLDAANISDASVLSDFSGKFVVVRGEILTVRDREDRIYLNFGLDWSTDFTVLALESDYTGDMDSLRSTLMSMKGIEVLVRGILEDDAGGLIRLVDSSQIAEVR